MAITITDYPFLWPFILVAMASIAAVIVGWRMFPFQKKALEELSSTQREVVNAKEAHIQEIERRFNETNKERDKYRDELHTERKLHQATVLRLAEMEARPNLTTLESLFQSLRQTMDANAANMNVHIESDAKMFSAIQTSMAMVPTAMREQADAFNKRQKEMLDRIELMFKTQKKRRTS